MKNVAELDRPVVEEVFGANQESMVFGEGVTLPVNEPTPTLLKPNITSEIITPEIAKDLLENNVNNRPMNHKHVTWIAQQMTKGLWQNAYDPIRFSVSGRLLDGQHRLAAIVASKRPQQMLLIWDLPEETFEVMDTGRIRNAGDILSIAGMPNARHLASTVRMIVNYERGNIGGTLKNNGRNHVNQSVTHSEILEFAKEFDLQPVLAKAQIWYKDWRLLSGTEYAFLYYVLRKIDEAAALDFLSKLAKGANLDATSPMFWLRKKFDQHHLGRMNLTPTEKLAFTFKAWNSYRKDKPVTFLTYNPEKETFPIPS